MRHAIQRGGLGVRLPNALRSIVLDSHGADITRRGIDPDPTGIVYSKASVRRQSGPVDLIGVFQTGTVVLPHKGTYLAVATKEAGGRRAPSMSSYPPNTFRVVKPKSRCPRREQQQARAAGDPSGAERDLVPALPRRAAPAGATTSTPSTS